MVDNIIIKKKELPLYTYWLIIIAVYFVLFEFILPVNSFLPRPLLIIDSIAPLFKDYNLLRNLFYSASGIYIGIFLGYLLIWAFPVFFISILKNKVTLISSLGKLRYFPLAGIVALFIFWFPYSSISEYLFTVAFSLFFLLSVLFKETGLVKSEYVDSALSLGFTQKAIYKNIYWKSCEPVVFHSMIKLHLILWNVMLFFEFLKGGFGIGDIYRRALLYKDLSALITISIIFIIILFTGEYILKVLNKKFIHWES